MEIRVLFSSSSQLYADQPIQQRIPTHNHLPFPPLKNQSKTFLFRWPEILTSKKQLTLLETSKICLITDIHTQLTTSGSEFITGKFISTGISSFLMPISASSFTAMKPSSITSASSSPILLKLHAPSDDVACDSRRTWQIVQRICAAL